MVKKRKRVIRKGTTKNKVHRAIKQQAARKGKGKAPAALRGVRKKKLPKVNRTKPHTRKMRAFPPPPREVGLLDAISEALSDITDLAQEMREWADSMEDRFGSTQKYQDVDQTADTLENIDDPVDLPTMAYINEIKITLQDPTPRKRGYSRSARCMHAAGILTAVMEKLDEEIGEQIENNMTELKDALEVIESELQGVEFPGMYG
jgi:hypothetical protein